MKRAKALSERIRNALISLRHCKDKTFSCRKGLDNIKFSLKIINYTFFRPYLLFFKLKSPLLRLFCLSFYRFLEENM